MGLVWRVCVGLGGVGLESLCGSGRSLGGYEFE